MVDVRVPANLERVPLSRVDRKLAKSGVYLLFDNDAVVYVGQSCSVLRRIGEHLSDRTKVFDSVALVPCSTDSRLWLERLYIERLRPRYNGVGGVALRKPRQKRQAIAA